MASRHTLSGQLPVAPSRLNEGKTTFVSVVSSAGAVLAACSCCILPMALAGVGLSTGLSSTLSPLGSLRWPMTAFSIVAVLASWFLALRQGGGQCNCPTGTLASWLLRPQIIALIIATKLTLVAAAWSLFEPTLMKALM